MHDELAARVRQAVSQTWKAKDPGARVVTARRPDGKLDVTVISCQFEALGSEERERLLWSVLRCFAPQDTVQMTYSLLVTPSEAAAFAADPLPPNADADRKDSD